ncbi:MAG: 30S ribosomal protein S20, partial [Acidobacteriota bacterium]|nr:30S ribosomal protein S20 [Acidobacteriota bacterium]
GEKNMERRKAGLKSVRQDEKHRALNKSHHTALKVVIKKYKKLVAANDSRAKEGLTLACSSLDKAATKGLIPKNRAARKKSRLSRLLGKIPPPKIVNS